ncbi:hypothetical protein FB561_4964 [Kribbella amoyensis]|uniref:Uncharacterized protein n=1 Tax=Kribbella amoyensis TaxID=996641 RepID=A0A561BY31_9ACTN|nr:hypothetical protein [Kribbella amoyensis]TWD83795.1 hypothetical protein FB561_4964 [Kribbella amoyensis]
MPTNELLAALVVVASAVILISFWRQILFMLLFAAVMVFCLGVYNVAVAMHG